MHQSTLVHGLNCHALLLVTLDIASYHPARSFTSQATTKHSEYTLVIFQAGIAT